MRRQDASAFFRKRISLFFLIIFLLIVRQPIIETTNEVLEASYSPPKEEVSKEIAQLVIPSPTPTSTPTPTSAPTVTPTLSPIPTATVIPTSIPVPTDLPKDKNEDSDDDIWEKLARCESGGNWSINTGNGYFGGLQFSIGAWASVNGSGSPSDASKEEQIKRAKKLKEERGWSVWGECAKSLGLDD